MDKYIKYTYSGRKNDTESKGESKGNLFRELASHQESPPGYEDFFRRYKEALSQAGATFATFEVKDSRLVIGLGQEGVAETSMTLHHTYGVPVIPATAIKGLMSHFAAQRLEGEAWFQKIAEGKTQRGTAQKVLFGDTEEAGYLVIYDALPRPGTWKLSVDVMTPHHQKYYTATPPKPPADWDSPVPVPFLTVAKGEFLFAMRVSEGGDPWLQVAWEILKKALAEEGIGAKTASGYGRLVLKDGSYLPGQPAAKGPSPELQRVMQYIERLKPARLPSESQQLLRRIKGLPEEEQKAAAQKVLEKITDHKRFSRYDWYKELKDIAES